MNYKYKRHALALIFLFALVRTTWSQNVYIEHLAYEQLGYRPAICPAISGNGHYALTDTNYPECGLLMTHIAPNGQTGPSKLFTTPCNSPISNGRLTKVDGGYLLSFYTGDDMFGLLMLDAELNVKWSYKYGMSNPNSSVFIHAVSQAPEQGLMVLTSQLDPLIPVRYIYWVTKLDKNGNVLWVKQLYDVYDMLVQPTGHVILAGQTNPNNNTGTFSLARLMPDGSLDWAHTFTYPGGYFWGLQIQLLGNGDIASSVIYDYRLGPTEDNRTHVSWISSEGDLKRAVEITLPGQQAYFSQLLADVVGGGLTLAGTNAHYAGPALCLAHLDEGGNVGWAYQSEVSNAVINGLSRTETQGFLVSGTTHTTQSGEFLARFARDGQGCETVPLEANSRSVTYARTAFRAEPIAVSIAKAAVAFSDQGTVPAFSKTDICAKTIDEALLQATPFTFFPNPASHSSSLFLPSGSEGYVLQVFDARGSRLKVDAIPIDQFLNLQVDEFAEGIYFYRLSKGDDILHAGKFVVAR